MLEKSPTETLTELATERLTADIVDGVLQPERKLLIADLKKHYGMGASPLREGLARLSTLGFVINDSRRGFRVAPMSREDLEDITRVRQSIETAALRRAIEFRDDEWEVGIIAAYARLQRASARQGNLAGADGTDMEQAHKQFHTALIASCRSRRLLQLQSVLYDQARRYRHLMLERVRDLDEFLETHKGLVDVVLNGQAEIACAMLAKHLELTLTNVYPEPPKTARTAKKKAPRRDAHRTPRASPATVGATRKS